tara:strand:+ start:58 stop:369 length:312 start_codon:yes stop_codon:yes gene_type:complete
MFKNFWFYFNSLPVLLGIFAFYKINSFPPRGKFEDAVDYCKDVDNEYMFDEGTEQDYCIDNFMMAYFNEALPWMILFLIGIAFIIPLCLYLIMTWRMHRYGHY